MFFFFKFKCCKGLYDFQVLIKLAISQITVKVNLQYVKIEDFLSFLLVTVFRHHRRIVLLGIQDEAYRFGRYYKYVLRRLHINPRTIRLGYRSSLALIGYVGRRRPYWVKQVSRRQRRGPSYASARIPLGRGEEITRFKAMCFLVYVLLFRSNISYIATGLTSLNNPS